MTEKQIPGQMSIFDLDIWCGRTFPEPLAVTAARTSESSLKKPQGSQTKVPLFLDLRSGVAAVASWETDGVSLGVYMMHSFGESPKDVVESHLSQILEDRPHPKYCLSAKACQGILRRAERRGKKLPDRLRKALEIQSGGVVYCLQGNGIDRAETAGCNGKGWREDQSYTLNTIDRPAVCAGFKAGQSKDGSIGYEEEKAPTLNSQMSAIEPTVLCAGFSYGNSANARSIGYETEKSPTLRGGEGGNQKPCVIHESGVKYLNPWDPQSIRQYDADGVYPTLCNGENGGQQRQGVLCRQVRYGEYAEAETGATIRASCGDFGGGSENLVIQ